MKASPLIKLSCYVLAACSTLAFAEPSKPIVPSNLVFEERDGFVAVEAEHFQEQKLSEQRAWHLTSPQHTPAGEKDGDPPHLAGASGGAYLELLPDSRRTHADELVRGENFSNEPGKMGVLTYKVHFNTPGRYYVWARAYSTGGEDNGLHVGLDGQWPASGARMQWCDGKNSWWWESKQRTEQEHCGIPHAIYLDVAQAGEHTVMFSMREDGFEFDKFILTQARDFPRPADAGPEPRVKAGDLPKAFAATPGAAAKFPAHWGEPPAIQTRDYRPLPGGYGMGSSTLAKWIQENLDKEKAAPGAAVKDRQPNGSGAVDVSGELKQWHKVTLTLDGPFAQEGDDSPNPFTDVAFAVTFTHESGAPKYTVPGYFAADGNAANSGADSGTKWRAHLSPDRPGTWTYSVSFAKGARAALGEAKGEAWKPFDGQTGQFTIAPGDKTGRDFRAHGRLQYIGRHHLQFAGSKEYFLKAGADSPETLLAYADFDGTEAGGKQKARSGEAAPTKALKTWEPHLQDWREGDPIWKGDKGKGLIGALNYLAGKGCNAFSFLTYNAGGDGDNVWPFVSRNDKLHYDCSKLDQWGIVFDHAQRLGLYCHFKLQETENDDQRLGGERKTGDIPEALDGGALGEERKLYLRELVARYGHLLALNWNLGEENTQSAEEQRAMSDYLREIDAYQHHRVIHTYPNEQDRVYAQLLGDQSSLTGASLQNGWNQVHQRTLQWVSASAKAGRPWVIANDEQGSADTGVPPDFGYKGYAGKTSDGKVIQTPDDIRKLTLWGHLMAGGAGVEYYFGYKLPENDLGAEDWRSRDQSWEWCRIALDFFRGEKIPFWEMKNANALIGNPKNENTKFCLAKAGEYYLVYLPRGGTTPLDLTADARAFTASWLNPRSGGALIPAPEIQGNQQITTPPPPTDPDQDWLLLLRSK